MPSGVDCDRPPIIDGHAECHRFASERDLFLEAGAEFMTAARRLCSREAGLGYDGSGLGQMELALEKMQYRNQELKHWDGLSNHGCCPARFESDPIPPAGQSTRLGAPEIKEDGLSQSSAPADDYAELYYQNAAKVKWLSEDLVNLGPRPVDGRDSPSHRDDEVVSTDGMTPFEYAEAHLDILQDLRTHREQAAMYKQICLELGIALEQDPDDHSDNLDEGNFQATLDELEHGTSRIDSMIVLNHAREQYPTELAAPFTESAPSSRVAEWATRVASEGQQTADQSGHAADISFPPAITFTECTEPSAMDDGDLSPTQCEAPEIRRQFPTCPSTYPPVKQAPSSGRRSRASSACSSYHDSLFNSQSFGRPCPSLVS